MSHFIVYLELSREFLVRGDNMFENLLSRFGINGLKINTKVDNHSFYVNGKLHGNVLIEGGSSSQEVYKIRLEVIEKIDNDDPTSEFEVLDNVLYSYDIEEKIKINPNDNIRRKFSIALPLDKMEGKPNQITIKTHVYLSTSVDNYDEDQINVIY